MSFLKTLEEIPVVKRSFRFLPSIGLLLFVVPLASAQTAFDLGIGFGTAHAKSTGTQIDTFGDGTLYSTPSLGSFFLGFGGDLMLSQRFGVGADVTLQPSQHDYAGLNSRVTFYDFNGIVQPVSTKRAALRLTGGIGGANMKFYYSQQYCDQFAGCSSQNQYLESSNHFQVHGGVGVQLYVTEHVFIRPQVDFRYVNNFYQYGSNFVPQYTVWVGYGFR
jgi:hypothetical protein